MDLDFPSEPAVVVPAEDRDMEQLRSMENELHRQAASIVQYAMRAGEIDPEIDAVPEAWLREMPPEEARRCFRVAQAAWQPASKAPAFLRLAQGFLVGVMKARATEKQGPRILNATLIQTTAPIPVFPERLVER